MTTDPDELRTRAVTGPDFTVSYGTHPDQIADVRLPPGDPTGPLVVFIHGGFWKAAFDRTHTGPLATDLAVRGYPVATIEYRRVGRDGGWPETFDDAAAALDTVPALVGARTGLDLTRPVVAGHSAGGHLALWYAGRPGARARGVVALAPVAELAVAYRLGLGGGAVAALLGGGPADVPDRYAAAQPARPTVPVVIVHGADDDVVPIEVSRAYAGADTNVVELPDTEHFALIDPDSTAWPRVLGALGAIGT
jgi:acetyl esterase/lipase